ncbi:MAG: hypothetical protein PHD72_02295 [Patescibacteria group bacterium]|nr:hypothetical protein [Patescibacteria group bacterium]
MWVARFGALAFELKQPPLLVVRVNDQNLVVVAPDGDDLAHVIATGPERCQSASAVALACPIGRYPSERQPQGESDQTSEQHGDVRPFTFFRHFLSFVKRPSFGLFLRKSIFNLARFFTPVNGCGKEKFSVKCE